MWSWVRDRGVHVTSYVMYILYDTTTNNNNNIIKTTVGIYLRPTGDRAGYLYIAVPPAPAHTVVSVFDGEVGWNCGEDEKQKKRRKSYNQIEISSGG